MVHRTLLLGSLLVTYYAVATYGLYLYDAGLLVTQLILFGFPALVLARTTKAPTVMVVTVTMFGLGLGVLLEGIAHVYGLWYSFGISELRLFGSAPLEMVAAISLQTLFLVLAYEALFDDARYTTRRVRDRVAAFVVFAVAMVVLLGVHYVVVDGWLWSYSYLWIIGVVTASTMTMLSVSKTVSVHFLNKVIDFALVAAVPLALSLWLAVTNVHKVFALEQEYVAIVSFFGARVPVEELVLLFVIPFFVATCYELYLDDQA